MHKKEARIIGLLFIIGSLSAVLSYVFGGEFNSSDYIAHVSGNENSVIMGALMAVIMALSCTGIAIAIYPIIKKQCPGLAIGSVVFRAIEGVLSMMFSISLLTIALLSQSGDLTSEIGKMLLTFMQNSGSFGAVTAFSIGALLYYSAFFKTKLIPRWLSIWGIAAASLHIIAPVLSIFGYDSFSFSFPFVIINAPIALQEMVFAGWLIIKGFSSPKSISEQPKSKKPFFEGEAIPAD